MAEAMQMLGPRAAGQQMSPEIMMQIEGLVAQYIAQEMQALKELSAQISGMGEGQGPDPLVALKQQELTIKGQQVQAGIANDQAKLELDRLKVAERAREFDERMRQTEQLAREKLRAAAERETMRAQMQMATSQMSAAQRASAQMRVPNRSPGR